MSHRFVRSLHIAKNGPDVPSGIANVGEFPVDNLESGLVPRLSIARDKAIVPFDIVMNQAVHKPALAKFIEHTRKFRGVLEDPNQLKVAWSTSRDCSIIVLQTLYM
jgi:hypothetical protein